MVSARNRSMQWAYSYRAQNCPNAVVRDVMDKVLLLKHLAVAQKHAERSKPLSTSHPRLRRRKRSLVRKGRRPHPHRTKAQSARRGGRDEIQPTPEDLGFRWNSTDLPWVPSAKSHHHNTRLQIRRACSRARFASLRRDCADEINVLNVRPGNDRVPVYSTSGFVLAMFEQIWRQH